jgi:hypothetical protein
VANRFPRITIRRSLVLVAALAVILGILTMLQRRRERFRHRAAEYLSAVHAVYFGRMNGEDGTGWTTAAADYHDDLSLKYKAAAQRPWLPLEADPQAPDGIRAFWIAHAAVKRAYPGVALDDYVAQITVFDGWEGRDAPEDRTIWAVRYRRRDNRGGMNVIVDDPVEIYPNSEGPPVFAPAPK